MADAKVVVDADMRIMKAKIPTSRVSAAEHSLVCTNN